MLLTKGNRTISLPDEMDKKIQNYKNAGWTEVEQPKVDPVEEPTETEETEDGSDSW